MATLQALTPRTQLTLRPDVEIVQVMELSAGQRSMLDGVEGDFLVSRRRSRQRSMMVDSPAADFIRIFRSPRSVSEAVILFSLPRQKKPEEVLEGALPLVDRFYRKGLLAAEGAEPEEEGPAVQAGDRFDDLLALRCLRQMEDVEVHQVLLDGEKAAAGSVFGALKLARPTGRRSVLREAGFLERLNGEISPRLLRRGTLDDQPYLLMEWCRGVSVTEAAGEFRMRGKVGRQELLELCQGVAEAYSLLHRRGVLHGDVHGKNLLAAPPEEGMERVRLVDFGLSRWSGEEQSPRPGIRAGVTFFLEPEAAAMLLAAGQSPPTSLVGEQYAVAALLYQLVTGFHTHDFSLEKQRMLEQLAKEPPTPFVERGIAPWPQMEVVLQRALAKEAAERYSSMQDLAEALSEVDVPLQAERGRQSLGSLDRRSREVLAKTVSPESWGGEPMTGPSASVKYGTAGVAYGLLRIAGRRQDPKLLARADAWCRKAELAIGAEGPQPGNGVWFNDVMGLSSTSLAPASPFHLDSGVQAVSALVAAARGDAEGFSRGALAFVAAASRPGGELLDLALGRCGALMAAAWLVDVRLEDARKEELLGFGHELAAEIGEAMALSPVLDRNSEDSLGPAHGWGGTLYALLQWHRASEGPLTTGVEDRLSELAALAQPWGRGMCWRWGKLEEARSMAAWCNGSAGLVFLWSLAGRLLGETRYFDLAIQAGWDAWDDRNPVANLCCGLPGRAYALLNLAKHSGDQHWLERARELARRAGEAEEKRFDDERPWSLFKGEMILPVLAADLEAPEESAFPFFEEEGWPPSP